VGSKIGSGDGVNENLAEKTILIVDDEDDVRESVREVLSDEGYRVVDTGDGTTVLGMIEEEKPGLVLLDIWMPKTDGIELLKEIKNKEPDINVVMISGHGNIHTAVTATKAGAFDFLEKPLSLDGLLLTVRRAFGEASVLPDAAAAGGSKKTRRASDRSSRAGAAARSSSKRRSKKASSLRAKGFIRALKPAWCCIRCRPTAGSCLPVSRRIRACALTSILLPRRDTRPRCATTGWRWQPWSICWLRYTVTVLAICS